MTRSQKNAKPQTSLYSKGAPEHILSRCTYVYQSSGQLRPLTQIDRKEIIGQVQELSRKALRCIAFAVKESNRMGVFSDYDGEHHPAHKDLLDPEKYAEIETDLTFLGVAGILVFILLKKTITIEPAEVDKVVYPHISRHISNASV